MGNQISFDFDEIYLKFSFLSDKKVDDLCFKRPELSCINIEFKNDKKFIFGKIRLTDIEEIYNTNKEEMTKFKQIMDQYLSISSSQHSQQTEKPPQDLLTIPVTGYGFDVYIDKITFFFTQIIPHFQFQKSKQIKAFSSALDYVIEHVPNYFFTLDSVLITKLHLLTKEEISPINVKKHYVDNEVLKKPYMIVNIKSGVSYYLMEGKDKFKRLSGSILGESTFISLIKLLTDFKTFDEAIDDAFSGDHRKVDMTVEDIYGGHYGTLGLDKDIIASSMGKAKNLSKTDVKGSDLSKSILIMMCMNIAQLSILVSQTEQIDTIVVLGSILTHVGFYKVLKSFMDFWAKGKKLILFPDNVEYLGCMGLTMESEEGKKSGILLDNQEELKVNTN
jgi:pantothenate kinase